MIIAKQISTMLGAGLPIIQALDVLVAQSKNKAIKAELLEVYRDVEGGLSLAKSFKKESKIFDDLQINLLLAGEKSGNLVEVFKQIAIDMEKKNQLNSKIRGAMIYPVIIFIVIIVVVIMMVVFMIPAVKDLYDDFGVQELPGITQFFVTISDFITTPGGAIISIVLVVGSFLGFRFYYRSKSGRKIIDKLLLRLPVFGSLFEFSQVVQLTRLTSMLIKSGMPIIESLKTVSSTLSNIHYKEAMTQAAIDVSKGSPFAVSLSKSEVIPIMLIKMVAIGEETGTLEQMLKELSEFYETELNNLADNLTKLMEPVILLIFGVLVGFLAVAIYLPIYQIANF